MHVISLIRDGRDIGFLASMPYPAIAKTPEKARKFSLPADAYCYLQSHPLPPAAGFGTNVVPIPQSREELARPVCT